MKIKNQTFQFKDGSVTLKDISISILQSVPSGQGVEASRSQIVLATKLEGCNGTLDITPEDASLIRSLLNHPTISLPPAVHVAMYDAFDPQPTEIDVEVAEKPEPEVVANAE